MQNKFSVKVGILAQGGGRAGGGLTQSQLLQITVFMAYLTLFCRKFLKNSRKKSQPLGRGAGVKPVGPNSQLLPKICFLGFPYNPPASFYKIYRKDKACFDLQQNASCCSDKVLFGVGCKLHKKSAAAHLGHFGTDSVLIHQH